MSFYRPRQDREFLRADRQALLPPQELPFPHCPVCGAELSFDDAVYTSFGIDRVVGCCYCLHRHYAGDFLI